MESKSEIRKYIKGKKKEIPEHVWNVKSECVANQLLEHKKVQDAQTILAYYPLADELDIRSFINAVYKKKRILLPIIQDDEILLKEYHGANSMREGIFHILEPDSNILIHNYESIDLVIVPGVAFTLDGKRLGRGKGYYDRFLPKLPNAFRLGVCFDFQVLDILPVDSFDQQMDEIIKA